MSEPKGPAIPNEEERLKRRFNKHLRDARAFLEKDIKFGPGKRYQQHLVEAVDILQKIDNPSDLSWLAEQIYYCVQLHDRLPEGTFDQLLIEAGMARIQYSDDPDFREVKVEEVWESVGVPPAKIHSSMWNERSVDYAKLFREYQSFILNTSGFDLRRTEHAVRSSVGGVLSSTVGEDDLEHVDYRHKKRRNIFMRALYTGLVLMPNDMFFKAIPGGEELIKPKLGDRFWVSDVPLGNGLVVTDKGLDGLMKGGPGFIYSNELHELLGHIAFSGPLNSVPVRVNIDGKNVEMYLDPKLIFPEAFLEGLANIFAMRYITNPSDLPGFHKAHLQDMQQPCPDATTLLRVDTNMPYFYKTLLTGWMLEELVLQDNLPWEQMELLKTGLPVKIRMQDTPGSVLRSFGVSIDTMLRGATAFIHAIDSFSPKRPDDLMCLDLTNFSKGDFSLEVFRRIYEKACKVQNPKSKFTFMDCMVMFDAFRKQYQKLWVGLYGNKEVDGNEATLIKIPEPDFSKFPAEKQKFQEEIKAKYRILEEIDTQESRRVRLAIASCMRVAGNLPERVFLRLLSECDMVMRTDRISQAEEEIDFAVWAQTRNKFLISGTTLSPEVNMRAPIGLLGAGEFDEAIGALIVQGMRMHGRFIAHKFDKKEFVFFTELISQHIFVLATLNAQILNTSLIRSGETEKTSLMSLMARASKRSIPEMRDIFMKMNYVFMTLEDYYRAVPMLQSIDSKSFIICEHPLSNAILMTDRAPDFFRGRPKQLFQSVLAEILHCAISETFPVKIKCADGKVVQIDASLALPFWLWEGMANNLGLRFYDQVGFWNTLMKERPNWTNEVPTAEQILNADLSMPYIYIQLFTLALFQTLSRLGSKEPYRFPVAPDFNNSVSGILGLIHIANLIDPMNQPQEGVQIGMRYFLHLYNSLRSQYPQLPEFGQFCMDFNSHRGVLAQAWVESSRIRLNNMYVDQVSLQDPSELEEVKGILEKGKRKSNWNSAQLIGFGTMTGVPKENAIVDPKQLYIYRDGDIQYALVAHRAMTDVDFGIVRILFDERAINDKRMFAAIVDRFAPDMVVLQFADPRNVPDELKIPGRYVEYTELSISAGLVAACSNKSSPLLIGHPKLKKRAREYKETISGLESRKIMIEYRKLHDVLRDHKNNFLEELWYFYYKWKLDLRLLPDNDFEIWRHIAEGALVNTFGLDGGVLYDTSKGKDKEEIVGVNLFSKVPGHEDYVASIISKVARDPKFNGLHLGVINHVMQAGQIRADVPGAEHILIGGKEGSRPGQGAFKQGFEPKEHTHGSLVLFENTSWLESLMIQSDIRLKEALINGIWLRKIT